MAACERAADVRRRIVQVTGSGSSYLLGKPDPAEVAAKRKAFETSAKQEQMRHNSLNLLFFALGLYLAAACTYCHVLDLYQTDPLKAWTIICGGGLIFIIVVSLTREFIIATLTGDFGELKKLFLSFFGFCCFIFLFCLVNFLPFYVVFEFDRRFVAPWGERMCFDVDPLNEQRRFDSKNPEKAAITQRLA